MGAPPPLTLHLHTLLLNLPMIVLAALLLCMAPEGPLTRAESVMLFTARVAYNGIIQQSIRHKGATVRRVFAD